MKRMIILFMCLCLAGCSTATKKEQSKKSSATTTEKTTSKAESKKEETVSITISGAGDVTLGKDAKAAYSTSMLPVYKANGASYFFKNVKSIFTKDDLTVVNFEGTLTNSDDIVAKSFNFKADPSYIDIIKEGGVDAVTFANNHVYDYSTQGYKDTIATFEKNKIPYASYEKTSTYKVKDKTIGMIAVDFSSVNQAKYEKSRNYIATGMKTLKKTADLIIVSMHGGVEGTYDVVKMQEDLAHYAIDQGANLVLGSHPHRVQGVEKYKNAFIAYSLGNFCFGGNQNPVDKDTMIVQKTFTFKNGKLVNDNAFSIIPCSVSSVSSRNNYQPTPVTGAVKRRIIEKVNNSSKPFNIKFDENGQLTNS